MDYGISNTLHHLLLIEDNEGDQKIIRLVLKKAGMPHELHIVESGEEALAYLNKIGKYDSNAPRPDLILLDLKLPGMNGHEVLKIVKRDKSFKKIPVVVLTGSDSEVDVERSYELHANCYIKKPADMRKFEEVGNELTHFWFVACKLPGREIWNLKRKEY